MAQQVTPQRNPFFAGPQSGAPAQPAPPVQPAQPGKPAPGAQPKPTPKAGGSFLQKNKAMLIVAGAIVFLVVVGVIVFLLVGSLGTEVSTKV